MSRDTSYAASPMVRPAAGGDGGPSFSSAASPFSRVGVVKVAFRDEHHHRRGPSRGKCLASFSRLCRLSSPRQKRKERFKAQAGVFR